MARYNYGKKNTARKWIYILSGIIVVSLAVFFIQRSGTGGKVEVTENSAVTRVPKQVDPQPEIQISPEIMEVEPEVVPEPNNQVARLLDDAIACIEADPPRIIEARDRLNELLPMPMSGQQRGFIKKQLSALADTWLFSRKIYPQDQLCESYVVKRGDRLREIGRRFQVPYEMIMRLNGIDKPEHLQANVPIKVVHGPFHAIVYRSTFTMDVYLQNTFVSSFKVGLGRPGHETPLGLWRVKSDGKLISPTWTDPDTGKTYEAEDPDYPLGSRWIGLEGLQGPAKGRVGFAIHGTKDPQEIGTAKSRGCIRLHNGNAVLVYDLMEPGVSCVKVVD